MILWRLRSRCVRGFILTFQFGSLITSRSATIGGSTHCTRIVISRRRHDGSCDVIKKTAALSATYFRVSLNVTP